MLALLLAATLLGPAQPQPTPRVLRVGPGQAYATPAAAVAAARAGDTVRVAAGTYHGSLVIDRPLVLLGEPGATLDGAGRGTLVTARETEGVVVAGLALRNSGRSLDRDDAAVKLVHCRACRVERVRVSESLHGIYLLESDGARVADNRIVGDSALIEPRRGNGVHLFNSHGVVVEGNTILLTRDGIYFAGAGSNRIVRNDVSRVRYGVHYMYSDDNEFTGNRFRRNAAGAAIMSSNRILFRDNLFADHVGYRAYGILLQTAEHVTAERNRIQGNLTGLFIDASAHNVFRENVVAGNGVGIDLLASSEANVFTGNAVVGNRTAVRKLLGAGENRWEQDGRGNYWGDPSVFDLDGDGVGDRPFRAGDSFASLAAGRPVLEVWVGTPAARALSWAEEAFPVFGLPRVEDPRPLVRPPAGLRVEEPGGKAPARHAAAAYWLALPLLAGVGTLLRRARHGRPRTSP